MTKGVFCGSNIEYENQECRSHSDPFTEIEEEMYQILLERHNQAEDQMDVVHLA